MSGKRIVYLVLGCLLLLGGGLRFYGLDWGTDPRTGAFHPFHPDETTLVESAAFVGTDLRQIKTSYGKAPIYLLFAAVRTAGPIFGISPFNPDDTASVRFTHLAGRALCALMGTLTVGLVFCIGRFLGGVWAGLAGAGLLCFCAGHIQQSHYYTVDPALSFWVALGIYLMLKMPSDRKGLYLACGVVCGLAAGTRLVGVWLGLPFVVAHLFEGDGRVGFRRLTTPQVWVFLVAAAVVTLACEPFLLLDPEHFFSTDDPRRFMPSMQVARGETVRIWTLYDFSTTPYLYYLTHLFRTALGTPLEVAALLGILLVVWRKEKQGWVLLSFLLPYFLLVGGLHTKPIRYVTPLLPLLTVLGAWVCVEGGRWLCRVWGRWPVVALPVVLVGIPTVGYGLSVAGIYGEEDSRIAAAGWVREHIPEGACVLVEAGGFPTAWMVPEDRYRRKLDKATLFLDAEGCFLYRDQVEYLKAMLTDVEWIVLVEENRMRQFLAVPDRYPAGSGFYRRLDSGKLGFTRVASFKVSPRIPGRAFSESDAEPTVTAFDHPRVSVFRRRIDADVAGLMAAWQAEVEQDARLPDRHILEGVRAYLQRDWRHALLAFQRAVETRPDFLLGHLMIVNTYLRQNREAEARRTWDWIETTYNGVPAETGVGMARAGLKADGADYLDQSLAGYRKVGREIPPWIAREAAQARFELGEEYRRAAQHGRAETAYLRAVELFPDFASPYVALGSLYLEREENGEALPMLKRAVHLDGINPEAWYLLAVVQRTLGDRDGAHASIRQALALRPAQASYRTEYLALTQGMASSGIP